MADRDGELIEAARRGDFDPLYDRYADWIATLAYRFCSNREDALDVVQDAFAYFFRKLPGFELRSSLKTFFYPVVKHLALSKKEATRRLFPLPEGTDPAAGQIGDPHFSDLLASLPDGQQEVVLLRFVEGLDLKEIAEALEIPLGTVKSRLHAALGTLRKIFRSRRTFRPSSLLKEER